MYLHNMLASLEKEDPLGNSGVEQTEPPAAQLLFLSTIKELVVSERTSSLVEDALEFALSSEQSEHVMKPSRNQLLNTLRSMLLQGMSLAIEYDENHPDFPITGAHLEKFAKRWLLHSLLWSFGGSASWEVRRKFSTMLLRTSGVVLPESEQYSIFDYRVRVEDGEYEKWSDSVPKMEIESHKAAASDVVITTTDTVRHADVLQAWLNRRVPLVLCGPPGSGKVR